ncbi:MAG TPA: response regulator [Gemmatimonadaceae bacterium]
MHARRALVSVIDDDQSVRESLPDLLKELGYTVQAFASAEAFLASDVVERTDCLLLDIAMPGMNGPKLQDELTRCGRKIPIIFITADHDATMRPRIMASGAVECLFKPFSESALVEALTVALRGIGPT